MPLVGLSASEEAEHRAVWTGVRGPSYGHATLQLRMVSLQAVFFERRAFGRRHWRASRQLHPATGPRRTTARQTPLAALAGCTETAINQETSSLTRAPTRLE